jgi:hypothetical protein
MALARIISRSEQCSRELERELLARGYAVEIVSPDAIPDGLVDLELRVEADAADRLTATVEARNGAHSASLAFVHRLQAPMGDIVRRPAETGEKVSFPAVPVSFNAEPGVAEDVELLSESWRAPEPAPKLEILPDAGAPTFEALPDQQKSARPITPLEQLLSNAKGSAERMRRGVTITFHRSKSKLESSISSHVLEKAATRSWESAARQGRTATKVWGRVANQGRARLQSCRNYCRKIAGIGRRGSHQAADRAFPQFAKLRLAGAAASRGWLWRAAIILAAVLVVAIFVGWGLSRDRAPSTKDSQTSPGKTAAAPNVNSSANPEPERAVAAVAVPTPPSKSEAKPTPISRMVMVHTKSKKSQSPRSLGTAEDDVVAHDTVVYFNKPASGAPAKDSSRRSASSHKQSEDTTP